MVVALARDGSVVAQDCRRVQGAINNHTVQSLLLLPLELWHLRYKQILPPSKRKMKLKKCFVCLFSLKGVHVSIFIIIFLVTFYACMSSCDNQHDLTVIPVRLGETHTHTHANICMENLFRRGSILGIFQSQIGKLWFRFYFEGAGLQNYLPHKYLVCLAFCF